MHAVKGKIINIQLLGANNLQPTISILHIRANAGMLDERPYHVVASLLTGVNERGFTILVLHIHVSAGFIKDPNHVPSRRLFLERKYNNFKSRSLISNVLPDVSKYMKLCMKLSGISTK